MAKIPVEKETGGAGWWKWLLGLLALVLLVWLIWAWAADGGEDEIAAGEGIEMQEEVEAPPTAADTAAAGGVITDLSTIKNASGREFVGRRIQLSNLDVTQMLGDSLFNVASLQQTTAEQDTAAGVLVVLDETTQVEKGGVEGRYNVNEGQRLTVLTGSIEQLDQALLTEQGLTGPDADQVMQENQYYIKAQRLNITAEG